MTTPTFAKLQEMRPHLHSIQIYADYEPHTL